MESGNVWYGLSEKNRGSITRLIGGTLLQEQEFWGIFPGQWAPKTIFNNGG